MRRALSGRIGGVAAGMWAALLLTALGARILCAIANPVIERDGVTFLTLARMARESDPTTVLRHDQHPLYPALAALAYPLLEDWQMTGLWISILAGTLTVIPVVLLGNRACGPPAGLLGGWLLAVARYPVHYTASAISDGVHGLLFTASIWAGAAALGIGRPAREGGAGREFGPRSRFLLAGFLSGAAFLARPEGLAAAAALLIAAFLKLVSLCDRRALRTFLIGSALAVLGLAVSAGPYIAFLNVEYGGPRITRKKQVFETLIAPPVPPEEDPAPSSPAPPVEAAPPPPAPPPAPASAGEPPTTPATPSRVALRLKGIVLSFRDFSECLGWIPLVLLLLGLIHRRRTSAPVLTEAFLFTPLLIFVVLLSGVYAMTGYVGRRHLYPPTTIVQGFAGTGLIALAAAVVRRRPGAPALLRSPAAFLVVAVLVILPKSTGLVPESGRDKDLWLREVGLSLQGTVGPADGIICPGLLMRIGFYSGGRFHRVSEEPEGSDHLALLAGEARSRKARWVIVDRPAGAPLPDPPPGFALARRLPHQGREVRLYRGPD